MQQSYDNAKPYLRSLNQPLAYGQRAPSPSAEKRATGQEYECAVVNRSKARTDNPPLERMGQMLDQMAILVREAASAQPILFASEVEDALVAERGLVDATIRSRRERAKQFPPGWFSDPAWDILLFLYKNHLENVRVTVGDVGHGTANRPTTTIRWLDIIESAGLLDRTRCTADTRRVFVFLNEQGVAHMNRYFDAVRSGAVSRLSPGWNEA